MNLFATKIVQIFFLDQTKIVKKSIIGVLKSEFKLRNRLSRDFSLDSQAAKLLCDWICVPTTNLRGYVQEICQQPFGLLLLSAIQVFT